MSFFTISTILSLNEDYFFQHGVRDSSVKSDEPERLRKEGSQQSSIIISGMESSGFDKYPEIGMFNLYSFLYK